VTEEKRQLIELKLSDKLKPAPLFASSPGQDRILSSSPSEYESESDDDNDDDATTRVASLPLGKLSIVPNRSTSIDG
jgi:hypothetical protein